MCHTPSAYPWNATRRLSGAHAGWRASRYSSVTRFAGPPLAGSVHRLPCTSIISVRPSGDSAAAMFVPSRRLTEVGLVVGALWENRATAPRNANTGVFMTNESYHARRQVVSASAGLSRRQHFRNDLAVESSV